MTVPDNLRYSEQHEWVGETDGTARVGITSVAVQALGDIVFVTLPDVGATVSAGEACGEVESTKSVSDIYAPVSGVVSAVNSAAVTDPSLVNTDPYGEGWLFEVRVSGAPGQLLDAAAYTKLTSA